MLSLNWEEIKNIANRKATLLTKTGVPFQIIAVPKETLTVRVRSGEGHSIRWKNLEKAAQNIRAGVSLNGPKDYRNLIADDRPTYV